MLDDDEEEEDDDNSFIHEIRNDDSDASCSTTGEEECETWEGIKSRDVFT